MIESRVPTKSDSAQDAQTAGSDPAQEIEGRNVVLLCGEVAAPVEAKVLPSGTQLASLAVRVPGVPGRRTSIPVTVWDPSESVLDLVEGAPVSVSGRVLRRFWAGPDGTRRSRVDIVADHVASPERTLDA